MHITIDNHKVITTPVEAILKQAQFELHNGKLKSVIPKGDNILINCPSHKGGYEAHPSCNIYTRVDDEETEAGYAYCFSCGYKAPLYKVIADLFDKDEEWGKTWLCDRFWDTYINYKALLPEISYNPDKPVAQGTFLSEDILIPFDYYHPYMWKRKLSKETVDRFRVGYDKSTDSITFPVYDEKHRLVMVTSRSVRTKRFNIPEEVNKPVYLLYDILERNCKTVYVCESQINTLYMRSLGYDAVGLFGTGSKTQLETLKKSGIRNFILLFDGDNAGRKGAYRFKQHMGNSVFITDILLPAGKDVNDLSPEEVHTLIQTS